MKNSLFPTSTSSSSSPGWLCTGCGQWVDKATHICWGTDSRVKSVEVAALERIAAALEKIAEKLENK